MRVTLDFNNNVIDNGVNGVKVRDERREDAGEGGRHGCAHYEERLRYDREGALP